MAREGFSFKINEVDIQIMNFISEGTDLSISDLTRLTGFAYKNVFLHIKKLEQNGFVKRESLGIGKKSLVKLVNVKLDKNFEVPAFELLMVTQKKRKSINAYRRKTK